MKHKIIKIFIIQIILIVYNATAMAKPTVAFGYLNNVRDNKEYKYMEVIFPDSFANSIGNIFNVNIKKPLDLEKELRENNSYLKKNYEFYELPELIEEIDSDIFVFGNFVTLEDSQIKITINIYMDGFNEIFSLTNEGRLETQISKLVDRISVVVINFMSNQNLYKVRKILPKKRLAILTNLEGEEQNRLLIAFMEKGYPVTYFQNNYIYNIVDHETINRFSYIRTGKNSYDIITDWRKSSFFHGTWAGKKDYDAANYIKNIYHKYDIYYEKRKNNALAKLNQAFSGKVDVLLIIGFSENRKTSWVRAIDVKEKELIWMQSNIKSDLLSFDPVMNNVNKIVDGMLAEAVNPFKKNK